MDGIPDSGLISRQRNRDAPGAVDGDKAAGNVTSRATLDQNCTVVPLFANGPPTDDTNHPNQWASGFFVCSKQQFFLVTAKHVLFEGVDEAKPLKELWFPCMHSTSWVKVMCGDGLLWAEDPSLDLVVFASSAWQFMSSPCCNHQSFQVVDIEKIVPGEDILRRASRSEEVAMFCYPLPWKESHPLEPFVRYGRTSMKLGLDHPEFKGTGFTSITSSDGDSGAPIFWIRRVDKESANPRSIIPKNYRYYPAKPQFLLIGVHVTMFSNLKKSPKQQKSLKNANITGFVHARHILDVIQKHICVSCHLFEAKKDSK